MLVNGGIHQQQQILSPDALHQLFADQTYGVPIVQSSASARTRYGLGVWRDRVAADNSALRISCGGAFGFAPWIDFDLGLSGIFMVRHSYAAMLPTITLIQDLAFSEMETCSGYSFIRGDANGDGAIDLADAIAALDIIFGSQVASCEKSIDSNDDGLLDIADPINLLQQLFGSGSTFPPMPQGCEFDSSFDSLTCLTDCP